MDLFINLIAMLGGAAMLSMLAGRIGVPYPTLLALGGTLIAFLPGAPAFHLEPELILALFVAPVLLDAAYDASWRDLARNWRPVVSLVVVAVGLTTLAVAGTARWLLPDLPWAAAIALGALLAPPDAVAAVAVMKQVDPPPQIRNVLEGESLLNDASALLIYKLAVGAVAAGSFSVGSAMPTFLLVVIGSAAAGWALTLPVRRLHAMLDAPAPAVIVQFVTTFAIWLLAEHLGLSAVVTIVVFAATMSRTRRERSGLLRVPTFAVWEAATFTLNVLAFTLIGLQLAPLRAQLPMARQGELFTQALLILAVVVAVRFVWVALYLLHPARRGGRAPDAGRAPPLSARAGVVVGWSGMRGIVTLAAALALPPGFAHRDFMLVTAFVVVVGTLVVQGLTLRPLLARLALPRDDSVERETQQGRAAALQAAMQALEGDASPAAQRLTAEYREALTIAQAGAPMGELADNALRRRVLEHSRSAIETLRRDGTISDEAFRTVEDEIDKLEQVAAIGARP